MQGRGLTYGQGTCQPGSSVVNAQQMCEAHGGTYFAGGDYCILLLARRLTMTGRTGGSVPCRVCERLARAHGATGSGTQK